MLGRHFIHKNNSVFFMNNYSIDGLKDKIGSLRRFEGENIRKYFGFVKYTGKFNNLSCMITLPYPPLPDKMQKLT